MNENGRRLLLDSIAYIRLFAEDRPIAVTPSVFGGPAALPRTYLDRRIRGAADRNDLKWMVTPGLLQKISSMRMPELRSWYDESRSYLHPSSMPEKYLEIDEQARSLSAPIDTVGFFDRCIAALNSGQADVAKELLARYAPAETENLKSTDDWSKWFDQNKPYLFFSDQSDYRWYIDPLAKKHGVPSAKLRGPSRASRL